MTVSREEEKKRRGERGEREMKMGDDEVKEEFFLAVVMQTIK